MRNPTLQTRKKLIEWMFINSQKAYTNMFKNHKPWGIYKKDLLQYPYGSLGMYLGEFLNKHSFELISKVERHDAYHVLTGYGINVEDEIALQCLCFGNGKRSIYLYGAVILGVLILPEYITYYQKSYKIGKQSNTFHCFDFKKLLHTPLNDLRLVIFTKQQLQLLNYSLT